MKLGFTDEITHKYLCDLYGGRSPKMYADGAYRASLSILRKHRQADQSLQEGALAVTFHTQCHYLSYFEVQTFDRRKVHHTVEFCENLRRQLFVDRVQHGRREIHSR